MTIFLTQAKKAIKDKRVRKAKLA
jgi:hypothetical protein